jgi:hypothetical protein
MHAPDDVTRPTQRPVDPPTSSLGLRRIEKGRHLKGEEAAQFAADVVRAYTVASIRRICDETGRSYGAIHRLLSTSGVAMRSRGYQRPASAAADVS